MIPLPKFLCRHVWLYEDDSEDTSGALPVFTLVCPKCGTEANLLGLQRWERVRRVTKNTWVLREVDY